MIQQWKCEECGHENPPTRSVFCAKCGQRRDKKEREKK